MTSRTAGQASPDAVPDRAQRPDGAERLNGAERPGGAQRPDGAEGPGWVPRLVRSARPGLRLAWLYASSRRVLAALAAIAACAAGLRGALYGDWDTYGALQLPLIFEAGAAAIIAITAASPFGEPERATGRWLPFLRLGTTLTLTAAAVAALAAAGTGAHLAGGTLDVLRNVCGLVGIGLLFAAVLGAGLSWLGPMAYLLVGVYALYTDWHPPTLTTPWIWPGRPPLDRGAAICAALVFAVGLALVTFRGPRD
jgi:hypothetical protein